MFLTIRDTEGTFPAKMVTINSMDLGKAEYIKKKWKEYAEELYKTGLNDLDNRNYVITHLEPATMECGIKWALGSIAENKASGGEGIPAELIQLLKDDAVKVLYLVCKQIWKLSSGHRTGTDQFSYESQRRAMPKNVQTTAQFHSLYMLARQCSKSYFLRILRILFLRE